jgi:predicted GNAT family N-acyltransferase
MNFLSEPLRDNHIRDDFSCGKPVLDRYLKIQAGQDIRKKLTACFVIADSDNAVFGYYTLSGSSIQTELLPLSMRKKIPQGYKTVPVILIGRLAVDLKYRGQHLGGDLLLDAMNRSLAASLVVGSIAVVVDPIDEDAKSFYLKYGFIPLFFKIMIITPPYAA